MKNIEELLQPFSFGQLQDMSTLLQSLENYGISTGDFREYVRQEKFKKTGINRNILKCPNCQSLINLYPVNTTPANQTGDNSKSVWVCLKCHFEKFNTESLQEVIRESNVRMS